MPNRAILILLIPPLLALAVHARVITLDFINMDDPPYVTENPHIQDGWTFEAVRWAFTSDLIEPSSHTDYWQPVTALSRILDVSLWRMNPRGHHLTNLLLHALNTFLVVTLLFFATGRLFPSVLAATLLAVHPLHVSSVAWVTERKDVLSLLFLLITLHAFRAWLRKPCRGRAEAVVGAFALSLMSKPSALTLPLILPLLARWPLGSSLTENEWRERFRGVWILSAVLFVLAVLSAAITLHGEPRPFDLVTGRERVIEGIVSIWSYLARVVWPANLAAIYPFPQSPTPPIVAAAIAAAVMGLACACIRLRARFPFLLAGGAVYVIGLLPTLGVVASSDRFTYYPMIGTYIAIAWTIATVGDNAPRLRPALAAGSVIWILLLSAVTYRDTGWWRNDFALFSRMIEVTGAHPLAERNLGLARIAAGDPAGALQNFDRSLKLYSRHPSTHYSRGLALERLKRETEAIDAYTAALEVDPNYLRARNNRAVLFARMRRDTDAEQDYLWSLSRDPLDGLVRTNLGNLYFNGGKYLAALGQYYEAWRHSPLDADVVSNIGCTLDRLGRVSEAVAYFEHALTLDPNHDLARRNLGVIRRVHGHAMTESSAHTKP
jgi:protein O-mannosyl-transferase